MCLSVFSYFAPKPYGWFQTFFLKNLKNQKFRQKSGSENELEKYLFIFWIFRNKVWNKPMTSWWRNDSPIFIIWIDFWLCSCFQLLICPRAILSYLFSVNTDINRFWIGNLATNQRVKFFENGRKFKFWAIWKVLNPLRSITAMSQGSAVNADVHGIKRSLCWI